MPADLDQQTAGGQVLIIEPVAEQHRAGKAGVFCFHAALPRGGKAQELTQPQHINTMLYEAEVFARLVEDNEVNHPGLAVSRTTAKLQTEIRRQTGVVFPADGVGAEAIA